MLVRHSKPTRALLRGPGDSTALGSIRVEHLAFQGGGAAGVPPLVLFGGAFQTFWSFRHDVERLPARWPVILLNLPGQGTNDRPSEGLDFSDLAELARRFLDHHRIDRIVPIGLSYGSGIAHRFATLFPGRVERLILGGVAPRLQPSLRSILRAARWLDRRGQAEEWAWSCVYGLINVEAAAQTGVPDELLEGFHRSLMRMPREAHERWWTNSTRLFTEELLDAPTCRTLVFASRHDHFMPPFQGAEVARSCADADFVILHHTDHLAPLERPESVLDLYEAFLDGEPVGGLPWADTGESAFAACEDRRVCARAPVEGVRMTVRDAAGRVHEAAVRDLGHHGAGLEWDAPEGVEEGPAPLRLRLRDGGAETWAVACPGSRGTRVRFLFTDPADRRAWIAAVKGEIGAGDPARERTAEV